MRNRASEMTQDTREQIEEEGARRAHDSEGGKGMEWVKKIFSWLTTPPRKGQKRGHPDFNPINLERIKKDLRLQEGAKRLGEANLPGSEEKRLTGLESNIVRVVEKARSDYLSWGNERLAFLNKRIQSYDVKGLIHRNQDADQQFERQANGTITPRFRELQRLSVSCLSLNAELENFRQKNNLDREAHYPEATMAFLYWAFLLLMIVAEGVVNASFFSKGIDTGLIGGFFYAAAFSFGNIASGYLWGRYAIPYANHASPAKRNLGRAAILGAIVTAVAIALLISHFRDALSHDAANAAMLALQNLKSNPLGLSEVQSWLLFGLSLLFAFLAVGDGYKMDDPCPGYGKLTRRLEVAQRNYDIEEEDVEKELKSLKEEALDEAQSALENARVILDKLHGAIEDKTLAGGKMHTAFADAENCLDALLKEFRDTNMFYRSNPETVPNYFSDSPRLRRLPLPSFEVEADRDKYAMQKQMVDDFEGRLPDIRANIEASFNREFDSLQTLEDNFSSKSDRGLDSEAPSSVAETSSTTDQSVPPKPPPGPAEIPSATDQDSDPKDLPGSPETSRPIGETT